MLLLVVAPVPRRMTPRTSSARFVWHQPRAMEMAHAPPRARAVAVQDSAAMHAISVHRATLATQRVPCA